MTYQATTVAECPEDAAPYEAHITAAGSRMFRCVECGRELAAADIYLEHDESWGVDRFGRLVILHTEVAE